MRVAIVNLTGGGLSGGYNKYLTHLLPAIRSFGVEHCAVFLPPASFDRLAGVHPGAQTWPEDDHRHGYRSLRAAIRATRPDVVFFPTARHLAIDRVPTVVMVRNMEPLATPLIAGPRPESVRNVARAFAAMSACRAATRVIAVSRYVRDFLAFRFRIAEAKIGVVYHGVDDPVAPSPCAPESLPEDLSSFVFTAGSVRPARGLEDAVAAIGAMRSRGVVQTLVIAGAVDPGMAFYRRKVEKLARRLGVASQVCWAGQLTPAQMSWCLTECTAFVMTSRVEACPNLVLEAMNHGCLSVSSDNSPMPEFFRDACLYYPMGDGDALAARLLEMRGASDIRKEELRNAGRRRAHEFTWQRTARQTVEQLALARGATPAFEEAMT